MNKRFPVLSTVAMLLKIVGCIAVLGGLLFVILGIVGFKGGSIVLMIGLGIGFCLSGLITVAFGEAIGVLFAIEENTRRASFSHNETVNQNPQNNPAPSYNHLSASAVNQEEEKIARDLLKQKTKGKAVTFASIKGNSWICVCGTKNPYDPSKKIQNCTNCHTNRNFALENWSRSSTIKALRNKPK